MLTTLTTLINRLDSTAVLRTNVIRWGCPVPSFGDLLNSKVATVGLNPSNREFMDKFGNELQGVSRRFHTLQSLGLNSWSDVDARHLSLILDSCRIYFFENPYNTWFKRLDFIVSGTNASYYNKSNRACHLDLIPYATTQKWTELNNSQRESLLAIAGDTLSLLLRDSPVRIIILNGQSVVDKFQEIFSISLDKKEMTSWSLPRQSRSNVNGFAYRGIVDNLSGISLGHKVLVLGYNHNIQSSFGVTTKAVQAIRRWVSRNANDFNQ
jgi:hypothetical protein